jgi:hypothetical protein
LLPDNAVVLRGGIMRDIEWLERSFEEHFDDLESRGLPPAYALSVISVEGLTVDELATFAACPHSMVVTTTVGALKSAGFVVEETPGQWDDNGHCDLYLERARDVLPTQDELEALKAVFAEPIPNVGRPGGRIGP